MSGPVPRPYRPGDAAAVCALHARYAEADHADPRSTLEPPPDLDAVRSRMAAAEWAVVAGAPDGWASLRSWIEDDGTVVFLTDGYVAPTARGRGLGRRLLAETEAVAARLAGGRTGVFLGGNASAVQPDRAALLTHAGYRRVFSMVEMEHDRSPSAPRPLPDGVALRHATVSDAPALHALAARVWAGRPFFTLPPEQRLRDWLARSDRSLFRVAADGDRVVGLVAAIIRPRCAEIDDVQVDPAFQRRGLASAMLARVLADLAGRGAGPVRLHTEGHDPAGALSLYERFGFRTVNEYHRFRKPLRL